MAPTPQLQWAGFLYNLKHLNASDRDIVMNFTRLDPIFRNVTNITGLLAIPPLELLFQNATNHTTAIMAKNATKMIPRGPTTYLGHVGNFTSLDEKTGAALSKVAKIGGGKLNGHFATPMLALVNIVAIIYSLFSMYAAAYLTKRASPEEFAALAAKNGTERKGGGRQSRRGIRGRFVF